MTTLYAVFGYPRPGDDRELLGAYSIRELAQSLIDAQLPEHQMTMRIEKITVDEYPTAAPWRKPESAAIAEIESLVASIVRESGRADGFNAKEWVREWLVRPHPVLGGNKPIELLGTEEGRRTVRELLGGMQAGTYF